jgi:hypothetical protein
VPNSDWSAFDPPKTVTHFLSPGNDEGGIPDLDFYRQYVVDLPTNHSADYSFRLAYFFHLLCDNLGSIRIGQQTRVYFAGLFAEQGENAWWTMKRDWYDLDHKYLRDHPDSLFWRVLLPADLPPSYLPFLPAAALHHQMQHIKNFYRDPGDRVLDRAYPYLNEATNARFVADTTTALLHVHAALNAGPLPDDFRTGLDLLPPALLEPFPPPLGDTA